MAKFNKECIKAAMEKLSDFSAEEVKIYMSQVYEGSKKYKEYGGRSAISLAIEEVNNDTMRSLFEDATVVANSARKLNAHNKGIISKQNTLNDLTHRSRDDKNKSYNIESAQRASMNKFHKAFYDDLNPEETAYLTTRGDQGKKNEIEIGRAIDGKETTAEAKKIAESHFKLSDVSSGDLVASNAMSIFQINPQRQLHTVHNRVRMLNPGKNPFKIINSGAKYSTDDAKKIWMDEIKQHLNLKETYVKIGAIGKDGNVDMNMVDKSLSRTFDNIANGRGEIFTKSGVMNDIEAIKKKQKMFFVWKDTESWMRYNQKFGSGDYQSAVQAHIMSTSNKVGTAEIFGHSPRDMFMNLLKTQDEHNKKSAGWVGRAENVFKHVTGMDKAAVDPTLAAFWSNLRSLTGMARLGNIGILSMGDVVKGALHMSQFGFGFWGPLMNNIKHIYNNPAFNDEERNIIAETFKLNCDSHMGYMGKFADATTVSDSVSKFTNAFYRLNLMHSLDQGNKISTMHMMAKGLGRVSSKMHDGLSNALKTQLEKYGISPDEWNLLRQKNKDGLFTTDNVEALTDDDLRSLRGPDDKTPLYEVKNNINRKIFTLFDVASNNAIGAPDVYMKAFLLGDTKAGTHAGELLRAFMQFKAFPLQHIDRMYVNAFKNADGVQAKSIYFANMFFASIGLNLLSNTMNNLMQGKGMPDVRRMSAPEKAKFMMENLDSNIGLLNKVFTNSYPGKFKAEYLLSSPSTDLLGNMLDMSANSIMSLTGDSASLKRAIGSAKGAAKNVFPATTIPFISPYLNQLMGDKSYLAPGQKQLFGK